MKILRLIHSLDPRGGGPGEGIRQITPLLKLMGHETHVVSLDAPAAPWLAGLNFPATGLGPGFSSYGFSSRLCPWLRAHLREYDLAIIHGLWQFHSFGSHRELQRHETPYAVYPHGMLDPWFRRRYPIKHLKKQLYWWMAEQKVLRDARGVVFTSDRERQLARNSFWPLHLREHVAPYGINVPPGDESRQREAFYRLMPRLRGKRFFLFLGRIHEKKGIDLILWALQGELVGRLVDQDMHLLIAGPTESSAHQAALVKVAAALPPPIAERVMFVEAIWGEEKWGALRAADCFLLFSHQENFGISVVEALACGLPVLISNQVNIWREIIQDGAGLAGDDTVAGAARLMRQWLLLDPAARTEMRRKAESCFHSRFENSRTVAETAGLLAAFSRP